MGDSDVIKSFLVGLGFEVDESSLALFNKSIQTAAIRVTALYTSISAFAGSMIYAFSKISEGFEEMGYQYHIIAPAINKAIVLRNELMKAYGAAGINIKKVIVDSINLNMSLTKTKYAMEAIYKSVGSKFFGLLQKQSDAFRKSLYGHMPQIIHGLETLVKTIFSAFNIIVQLGMRIWDILSRVYNFFDELDTKTNGWSTIILGVVAAWNLLNLAFLATPLGALIAGIVTLIALWDDFQVWREGGKSMFDWGPFIPIINAVTSAMKDFGDVVGKVFQVLFSIGDAIDALIQGDFGRIWTDMKVGVDSFNEALKGIVNTLKSLLGVGGAVSQWAEGFGNWDVSKKVMGWIGGSGSSSQPLGSNTTNNNQRQMIANQQTNINVTGSANAQSTGAAVAAQQGSVNAAMVRNLKEPTR
jgi:hypothetical protein